MTRRTIAMLSLHGHVALQSTGVLICLLPIMTTIQSQVISGRFKFIHSIYIYIYTCIYSIVISPDHVSMDIQHQ